jgi:tRNA modification GTPase
LDFKLWTSGMNLEDAIVAVSSPAGAGERAIIRLSGPRAIAIADEVFRPIGGAVPSSRCCEEGAAPLGTAIDVRKGSAPFSEKPEKGTDPRASRLADAPTFTAHVGRLEAAGLSVPATVYLMKAPRSYTRQDVVEFHVGAWPAVVGDLVAGLAAAGARPAEPGEFTFRALLSGRLDLAQAEAVMAVITAADRATLRAAEDLLGGHLSAEIERLAEDVHETLALVEAGLDFSDSGIEIAPPAQIAARIDAAGRALADLGRRARGIETVSGRVRLVLAGRPNAGKSSLFNRLLVADRAIVSPEAGTTRDELRAALHIDGLEFTLSDTAGVEGAVPSSRCCEEGAAPLGASIDVRKGSAPFSEKPEKGTDPHDIAAKAQAKALAAIGGADLVLVALDATEASFEGAEEVLRLAAAPVVVAITKCDLAPPDRVLAWLGAAPSGGPIDVRKGSAPFSEKPEKGTDPIVFVATSAVTGQGIDQLRAALVRAVRGGTVDRHAAGPVVTARHRAAMEQAAGALARAAELAGGAVPSLRQGAVPFSRCCEKGTAPLGTSIDVRKGSAPFSEKPEKGTDPRPEKGTDPSGWEELVAVELREALDAFGSILGRQVSPDILGTIFTRFCIGK